MAASSDQKPCGLRAEDFLESRRAFVNNGGKLHRTYKDSYEQDSAATQEGNRGSSTLVGSSTDGKKSSSHFGEAIRNARRLRTTLVEMATERRQYKSLRAWHKRLEDDYPRGSMWLWHHPKDIAREETTPRKRKHKNPWTASDPETAPVFDTDIFDRPPREKTTQRGESPKGTRYDAEHPPLPRGTKSWEEVQGQASTPASSSRKLVQRLKCKVSRYAWSEAGLAHRDRIGGFIDRHNVPWPARYRFVKAEELWVCS